MLKGGRLAAAFIGIGSGDYLESQYLQVEAALNLYFLGI